MRLLALTVALGLCLAVVQPVCAEETKLETDADKILYSLGFALSRSIVSFQLNEAELDMVLAGMSDAVLTNEPRIELEKYGPRVDAYLKERVTGLAEAEKVKGMAFQAEMAAEPGAVTLPSGLIYREITPGDGPSPGPTDTVKIDYHGTLRDGSVFDSSIEADNPVPATFALNRVIPCFGEGLQQMKVGGKSTLTCPSDIAYGDQGGPPKIPAGATLVFEVTLHEIVGPPKPAPVPAP